MARIVQFNSEARDEIRDTVTRMRTRDIAGRKVPVGAVGYQVWYFELLETLGGDQGGTGSSTPALAVRRRKWDDGRWIVNRVDGVHNPADEFYVYDGRGVGYCGDVGAWGAAEMDPSQPAPKYNDKRRLAVVDLECPGDSGPDCSEFA